MAKRLGNQDKVFLRAEADSAIDTFTWLGGEQNNSVNRSAEAVEVSDKSDVWAMFIYGKKGTTIEVTVFADSDDDAQMASIAALEAGTRVEYAVGAINETEGSETEGEPVWGDYGHAIITAVNDSNDGGSVASRTISLTATGENAYTPEPAPVEEEPAENDE